MQRAFCFLVSIPLLLACAGCLACSLWVEAAVLAAVCFLLLYPWAPLPQAAASGGGIGAGKLTLLVLGAVIAAAGPALALLSGLASQLPGCSAGISGGPAQGCRLAGVDIDGLVSVVMPAFLLSVVTVPAGLLLMLLGAMLPKPKPVAVDKWIAAGVEAAKPTAAVPAPTAPTLRPASQIAIDDAVQEALVNYRAGCRVRTRCPSCRAVLLVASDSTAHVSPADQVAVSCACGACDGKIVLRQAPC